jgi:hypothetical protein
MYIAKSLIEGGKHSVTALTRADSTNKISEGVIVKIVDYNKPGTIVDALKGQEVLIITLNVFSPPETEMVLVDAAAKAGVAWVLPNHWGCDTANEALVRDLVRMQGKEVITKAIEETGMSHISLVTSYWYEWSLSFQAGYGFDIPKKNAIFFDEGKTKICTSTWPQVGRAVAGLLSLPIQPEGSDVQRSLENFRNKIVYMNSFTLSQMDMLESILRVTGDKMEDWTISFVPARERYANAIKVLQEVDGVPLTDIKPKHRFAFSESGYTRMFFPDGSGNYEHKGLINDLINLPKENLDEATSAAVERAKFFKFA